jgi:phosphatidylglycerophosphatase A
MKLKLRPGALPPEWPLRRPETLIVTWFGTGLAPIASGTWGSLAALPFGWLALVYGGVGALVALAGVISLLGIWASSRLVAGAEIRDPGFIVIDEVAGMLVTLAFAPMTWWGFALAFFLFRAADIVKPFPANWCDAHVHGGLGVMLDDLVAGLYAGLATWLLSEFVVHDLVLARVGG